MKRIFDPGELIECIDTNVNDFSLHADGYNVDCERYGFDSMRFKSVDIKVERKKKLKQIENRG